MTCTLKGLVLKTYCRATDVELDINHFWHTDPLELGAPRAVSTISGRCFTFASPERFQPSAGVGDSWLGIRTGGLFEFQHQGCQFVPSTAWEEGLGLSPSVANPLVWTRGQEGVARFERFAGPFRDEPHGHEHRQPMLFRWVARKIVVEDAVRSRGGRLARYLNVNRRMVE